MMSPITKSIIVCIYNTKESEKSSSTIREGNKNTIDRPRENGMNVIKIICLYIENSSDVLDAMQSVEK